MQKHVWLAMTTTLALSVYGNAIASGEKHKSHDHHHHHEEKHDGKKHEQEAHVHGIAELTMVLEGNTLEMAFESPAANIVGFEHAPSTDEQKLAVKNADAALKSAESLFAFSGTSCELQSSTVEMEGLQAEEKAHHDHGHDKHGQDKHGHDKHGHDKHEETHSDVEASYQFACKEGSALEAIDVLISKKFGGVEKLETQWVFNGKQGAAELSAQTTRISVK